MYNIQQLLNDYNIKYKTEGDNWLNVECPICHHSGKRGYKGGFNTSGYYHCWNCGGHDFKYVLSLLLNIKKHIVDELLNNYDYRYEVLKNKKSNIIVKKIDLIGGELRPIHKKYLKNRGLNPKQIISKYGIKGTLHYPPAYRYRIIVPIFHNKKLISYQARAVNKEEKLRWKGLSPQSSVMNYKYTLYGIDDVIGDKIGIVEGIIDQWKMGNNFVCSFGMTMTDYQLKLLLNFNTIFFLFDNDALYKAKKYAKIINGLKNNVDIQVIDLEMKDKDPGDLSKKEVENIRKELKI